MQFVWREDQTFTDIRLLHEFRHPLSVVETVPHLPVVLRGEAVHLVVEVALVGDLV